MNFKKLLLTTLAALCLAQPAQAMNKELLTKAYGIGKEVLQKHPGKAAIALWVAALLLPKRSPKVLSKALMLAGTGLLVYEYPKTTLTAGGLFIAAALIISYKIVTINARLKIKRLENNLETHKDIDDDINIDESFKDNVKSNNETQKINVQQQNLTISTNNESLKNDVVEEIKKYGQTMFLMFQKISMVMLMMLLMPSMQFYRDAFKIKQSCKRSIITIKSSLRGQKIWSQHNK